ncbi:hypothetical protein MLD38_025172 [Melastoma candidum]|uniref:Uncharacterized protein n=1 Tax=Melastoma candidum TaxID=119954 RepID=A0ACB9NXE5_9MYRT|nr:hypothetical protein MLD38_025172 [Melastoma candidum]
MDYLCCSTLFPSLPGFTFKTCFHPLSHPRRRSASVVVAGVSRFHPSLNIPLLPLSTTGIYLTRILQNQRQLFHVALDEELCLLASQRDETALRIAAAVDDHHHDEACLYRRIAEVKQREWQVSIRDLMYADVLFKFGEIKVHLVPRLCKCIYNGRLELWPAKDWELESIHGIDSLEMIKEHVAAVIGLRADSSVSDNWAITRVERPLLREIYGDSISYGYFLKSASLRHNLEHLLTLSHPKRSSRNNNFRGSNLIFGHTNKFQAARSQIMEEKRQEKLRCYLLGFDKETLQRCMKIRSKEAADLIEKHTAALFGEGKTGSLTSDETILSSFSSLKRLVLEAIAFGSFLWDVEEHVDAVYKLNDNLHSGPPCTETS